MNTAAGDSDGPTSQPGLSVAAVARRLGVAPATLRTWDRRYGLGPSVHPAGSHRRYTAADMSRLEHMRRLVLTGVPPGDAARAARDLAVDAEAGTVTSWPGPARRPQPDPVTGHGGGGQVVPMPGGTPAARGLARAAMALDVQACTAIIDETLARRGVVWTWDRLLVPVLVGVGQRWESTGRGVEVEHVLSNAVFTALGGFAVRLRAPRNVRPVLLASAAGEQHSLPTVALAAALAERGLGVRQLGARVPADALATAVRRIGPAAVLVWSQQAETGDPGPLADLTHLRPPPLVLVGGPGWPPALPAGIESVPDLTGAVARIARAVGE